MIRRSVLSAFATAASVASATLVLAVGTAPATAFATPSLPAPGASYTEQLVAQAASDPAFTFGYEFSIGAVSPREALELITGCLSCYLPLGGTPDVLPDQGTIVPFTVPVVTEADDFTSKVTVFDEYGDAFTGFQLEAVEGNLTGDGSVVAFGFYRAPSGEFQVSVDGLVMNDLGADTATYQAVTSKLWAQFAANLAAADS